jgi:prepilin-type N-terminal cleavage/methylation domain-containing protein
MRPPQHARRRSAFTLVELLVVISIILVLMGLIVGLPGSDKRHAAVRAAAEELAATLRSARTMAMNQGVVCGVAFNIQNAPGTSGLVLNNWSGGHWYRVIGAQAPRTGSNPRIHTYPIPDFVDLSVNGYGNVAQFLAAVEEGWLGDTHVLTPRRVRFLALSDQDSGSGGWVGSGQIPATYPRPWYGYWSGGTLYPWGGYDGAKPARIKDAGNRNCSGFYYEGDDGTITGCTNHLDRSTTATGASGTVAPRQFIKTGTPRPLVNAAWLDVVITFNPDGTVCEPAPPMYARNLSYQKRNASPTSAYSQGGTGNGDLGPYSALRNPDPSPLQSFWRHTGRWSITLAADAEADTDAFPSASAALRSIWPLYRVTVDTLGNVQVVQVGTRPPDGLVFDTTSISNWQTAAQITTYYKNFIATNADGTLRTAAGGKRFRPVDAFLTPEILASRQWWATW